MSQGSYRVFSVVSRALARGPRSQSSQPPHEASGRVRRPQNPEAARPSDRADHRVGILHRCLRNGTPYKEHAAWADTAWPRPLDSNDPWDV